MNMAVHVKAPGRVCLLGDKSDLLNRPVIAAAISNFFEFEFEESSDGNLRFEFLNQERRYERPFDKHESDEFFKFFSEIAWHLKDSIKPFECRVKGDLAVGSGLSSSAACSVGFIRGLNEMFSLNMDNKAIAELSFQIERNVLGISCGRMDQYSIAYGGITFIETGDETKVTYLPSLTIPIVVGDSCEPRAAKQVLNKTMKLLDEGDEAMHAHFREIHQGVLRGVEAIRDSNLKLLGELMNNHQRIEEAMEASTPKLMRMCREAIKAGALGAKQIGAGGGGCMIALAPENPEKIIEAIQSAGGRAWIATVHNN